MKRAYQRMMRLLRKHDTTARTAVIVSSFIESNSCKIMLTLRNHRGRAVRDILAQTSADGKKRIPLLAVGIARY